MIILFDFILIIQIILNFFQFILYFLIYFLLILKLIKLFNNISRVHNGPPAQLHMIELCHRFFRRIINKFARVWWCRIARLLRFHLYTLFHRCFLWFRKYVHVLHVLLRLRTTFLFARETICLFGRFVQVGSKWYHRAFFLCKIVQCISGHSWKLMYPILGNNHHRSFPHIFFCFMGM